MFYVYYTIHLQMHTHTQYDILQQQQQQIALDNDEGYNTSLYIICTFPYTFSSY